MFSDTLQTVTTAARARVKFRLAGGAQPLPLLPVRVNERGPYEFILDTGAGTSVLTPELAHSLGIKRTGSRQGHTAGGPVNMLAMLSGVVDRRLDGIIGYNFLRHFRVAIDYPNEWFSLFPP